MIRDFPTQLLKSDLFNTVGKITGIVQGLHEKDRQEILRLVGETFKTDKKQDPAKISDEARQELHEAADKFRTPGKRFKKSCKSIIGGY